MLLARRKKKKNIINSVACRNMGNIKLHLWTSTISVLKWCSKLTTGSRRIHLKFSDSVQHFFFYKIDISVMCIDGKLSSQRMQKSSFELHHHHILSPIYWLKIVDYGSCTKLHHHREDQQRLSFSNSKCKRHVWILFSTKTGTYSNWMRRCERCWQHCAPPIRTCHCRSCQRSRRLTAAVSAAARTQHKSTEFYSRLHWHTYNTESYVKRKMVDNNNNISVFDWCCVCGL